MKKRIFKDLYNDFIIMTEERQMSFEVAYKIANFIKNGQSEIININDKLKILADKYGKKDKNGNLIKDKNLNDTTPIKEGCIKKYNKEADKILNKDIDININFEKKDFGENNVSVEFISFLLDYNLLK